MIDLAKHNLKKQNKKKEKQDERQTDVEWTNHGTPHPHSVEQKCKSNDSFNVADTTLHNSDYKTISNSGFSQTGLRTQAKSHDETYKRLLQDKHQKKTKQRGVKDVNSTIFFI